MRLAAVVLALLAPGLARAAEGDHAFSLAAGYGTYGIDQENASMNEERRTMHGGALVLDYDRGFGDAWGFRITATGGLGDGPGDGLAWSSSAAVGLRYAVDVLRYVPWVHGGVGAMIVGGGGIDREIRPIVELGAGLDIIESTKLSWGFAVRVQTLGTSVVFFTVTPRISFRWGYF